MPPVQMTQWLQEETCTWCMKLYALEFGITVKAEAVAPLILTVMWNSDKTQWYIVLSADRRLDRVSLKHITVMTKLF